MGRHGFTPASLNYRKKKQRRAEDAAIKGKALKDLKKLLGKEYTPEDGVKMMALLEGKQRKPEKRKKMGTVELGSLFMSKSAKRARRRELLEEHYKVKEKEPAKESSKSAAPDEVAMPIRSRNPTTHPDPVTQAWIKDEENGDPMEL